MSPIMNFLFCISLPILMLLSIYACGMTQPARPMDAGKSSLDLTIGVDPADATRENIDPDSIEPGEVCVVTNDLSQAEDMENSAGEIGYPRKKRRALSGLGFVMSILEVPLGYSVRQGITVLRSRFPDLVIDANHRYIIHSPEGDDPRNYAKNLIRWGPESSSCGSGIRLGLVDTHIDRYHPVLRDRRIETRSFVPEEIASVIEHGTSVAALLVGKSADIAAGLLPESSLYVAEIFRQRDGELIDTTTWLILRALDWLVSEDVTVINLSFGGPPNDLLAFAVSRTLSRNVSLVAAAGHRDPLGKSSFPAAQAGVIAVTAIDAELLPYRRAATGSYISLSAPGVDIWVPGYNGTGKYVSGTSFAAPFVTAAFASLQKANPQWTALQIRQELEENAKDLGNLGWDPLFGWGLVQVDAPCPE